MAAVIGTVEVELLARVGTSEPVSMGTIRVPVSVRAVDTPEGIVLHAAPELSGVAVALSDLHPDMGQDTRSIRQKIQP